MMKIVINLISQCAVLVMITCFLAPAEAKPSDQRVSPNIVMIFVDDLHYGGLGVTGSHNTMAKTPAIDSIFKDGVRFTNGYATHAVCAPSRAGLMTGRYQARFGFETLPGGTEERVKSNYGVDTREVMISALLKKAGYATCAIGKWHLGTNQGFQPHERGFDHWFGYRGSCGYYQFRSQLKSAASGKTIEVSPDEQPILNVARNGHPVRVPGYLTDAFAKEAADWIKSQKDKPFFLYFAPYNVHAPDKVRAKYIPKGGTAHDGVIAAMDASVAAILDALETAGVADNTLVVFSNDNGGKKDLGNNPFRGNKATYYEGGVRVPFAMRWPGAIKPNTRFDGMVSTLDILPTFAAAAGVKTDGLQLDGKNLLPFLSGKRPANELRQIHFWRTGKTIAARKGDWKLVWPIDPAKHKKLLKTLGIEHFKGRRSIEAERDRALYLKPELYNLATDIGEATDVAAKHPDKVAEIIKDITEWESNLPRYAPNRERKTSKSDSPSAKSNQPPNVVLIFADDMGWGDVGYHGYKDVLTPNIDRIAAEGVHFRQGYVSASVCGPSRAGLMTGVYQQRVGAGENASATGYPNIPERFRMSGLPTSQPTLAETLRPKGYRCGMIGKWHLGVEQPLRPHYRGFNFFWGFLNGSHSYVAWDNKFADKKDKWPLFRNDQMLLPAENIYLTDLFSDRAIGFIKHNTEKPFFLYLAYNAVHHPWQVPDKYLERTKHLSDIEDRRFFAAMILAMDDGVGRILKTLDEAGVADNTIVIFLSDNGSPRGQGLKHSPKDNSVQRQTETMMSNSGPFRGFKGDTYEGGIRVPFTMRWPGKIRPNTRYDQPVSALDIAPTIAATVGIDKPSKGHAFDGVNLLPYLNGDKGDARPHKVLYWRRDKDYAIREGDWKLSWNDASGSMSIKLFDLADDPGEHHDLAAKHPDRAQRMQDLFDAWDSTMPDSKPWGGPGNRNRSYAKEHRVDVTKYNASPPTRPPAKVRNN